MSAIDPYLDIRMAGQVLRYHSWPTVQKQTVAEHSYHVARILMSIANPELWDRLLPHALLHDLGEQRSGDLPFPVKRDNPDLKRVMDRIEGEHLFSLCMAWMPGTYESELLVMRLTTEERVIFKIADMMEMWEFGIIENRLGNQYASLIIQRTADFIHDILMELPHDHYTVEKTELYMKTRVEVMP